MRPEEFDALLEAGIVGEPVEFIGGRWAMGRYEFHFTPEMAADAVKLGNHPADLRYGRRAGRRGRLGIAGRSSAEARALDNSPFRQPVVVGG